MNYIPGFTNYLQSTVPAYADGGAVMAVEPTTQEAAPYDLSALAGVDLSSLYGLNLGGPGNTGLAGLPSLGAGYKPLFEEQLITAPISNKGNPTAYGANNQFYMSPNNLVRIIDRSTNKVLFEGVGYDAAKKAVEIGQNLTDTMGRSASYQIETGTTPDNYSPVANEKYNPSTLSKIGNVAGTVLPLAMMAIPGVNAALLGGKFAATTAGQIAFGALTGAASSGLKGDNILKGAALGGLTAAGGALIPKIPAIGDLGNLARPIGTGIGSTVGNLVTGQDLKNSLLSGVASGALAYAAPDIVKGLGIGGGSTPSTSTGGGGSYDGINVVGGQTITPGLTLGGSPNKIQQALAKGDEAPFDGITATGNRLSGLSGFNFGGDQFGAPGEDTSAFARLTDTTLGQTGDSAVDQIDVTGTKLIPASNVSIGGSGTGALSTVADTTKTDDTKTDDDKKQIDVTGTKLIPGTNITVTDTTTKGDDTKKVDTKEEEEKKKKLGVEEYLRLAALAAGLIGGGGGKGQTGYYGGGGSGRLNSIFSAKLPAAGGLGTIGATRTPRALGDVDWLTYATRPELRFFDYAQPATPAPVTTPVPGNPAGPAMYVPNDNTFARGGGAFAAKRGGRSQRTEFAVNGPGTGRSDDIPAVLSDGEYVIDAETVALLGDGSSRAGAKKLDELRVKIRKHKGQKLAKGRFSANAKRPEAYLSGGRV